MEWVLVAIVLAVAAAWGASHARTRPAGGAAPRGNGPPARSRPAVDGPFLGPLATVRLDVAVTDADAPAVRRLVDAASARVLRSSPDVTEVIVEDRRGRVLQRVPRQVPSPGPPPTRPEGEVHHARPRGSWREPDVVPGVPQDGPAGRRPLADRLDLPEQVRAAVREPDDAVEIVRVVLEAAGRDVTVRGDAVRSGDDLVLVVEPGADAGEALSRAFLRFRDSGARQGIVVHLGYVDPREVARRRSLTPRLHHAGPEVLQAMADAAALGGDPVQFALADLGS